jgi:hypothetical protein
MIYLIPRYTEQTRRGIDLCLGEKLVVPALALLYSAIDVLGFLRSDEASAKRETFTAWVEAYMVAFLNTKGIRGIDLYSARCGIVHTGQAASDLVKSGQARELWYQFRGEAHVNLMANLPEPPVLVDVDELVEAFTSACKEFVRDIRTDDTLGSRAEEKAGRFFRPGLLFRP